MSTTPSPIPPCDSVFAAWRPKVALPAAPAFHAPTARQILRSIPASTPWSWEAVPALMDREEALFWWTAMGEARLDVKGAQLDALLTPARLKDAASEVHVETARTRLQRAGVVLDANVAKPLAVLLESSQLLELLLNMELLEVLGPGARYMLARMEEVHLAQLREQLRPMVLPSLWPRSRDERASPAFAFAALLGMPDEMAAVAAKLKTNRYRGVGSDDTQGPQDVVFGLSSSSAVVAEMTRLGAGLSRPHHVRAWIAHTGWDALDWVERGIAELSRNPVAMVESLALMDAQELAPLMERLASGEGSFNVASDIARDWLSRHGGAARPSPSSNKSAPQATPAPQAIPSGQVAGPAPFLLLRTGETTLGKAATRFGGTPQGPAGMAWPRCLDCHKPLTHGGQLNLGDADVDGLESHTAVFFVCTATPGECQIWEAEGGANHVELVRSTALEKLSSPLQWNALFKRAPPAQGIGRVPFQFGKTHDGAEFEDDEAADAPYSHAARHAGTSVVGMMGPTAEWLQEEESVPCPCGATMRFFALLEDDTTPVSFGGGRAYFFACAHCKEEARMLTQR